MTDYYYPRNKFIEAAPLVGMMVLLVFLSMWIVYRAEAAADENTKAIMSAQALIIDLQRNLKDLNNDLHQLGEVVASVAELQSDLVAITRENNNSIRLLEMHPLLKDNYDDFGRRAR